MNNGQIIVTVISLVGVALIAIFYNKMPDKLRRAIAASTVFMFSVILFKNFMRSRVVGLGGSDAASLITSLVLLCAVVGLCFAVVYFIKDEEKQRRIFFQISLLIFTVAYVNFTLQMINGFTEGFGSAFPSHLCRQIAYGFPLVYFCRHGVIRKWVLPYFVLAGIIGAIATLYVPNNILNNSFLTWGEFDTVLSHVLLLWVPVIIIKMGLRPTLWHLVAFTVGMGISTLFAWLNNAISYWQAGDWGNGMYLTRPAETWFPTWLFAIVVFVVAIAIVVPFNGKVIYNFCKRNSAKQPKVEKDKNKELPKPE